jgi:hypothetical protein
MNKKCKSPDRVAAGGFVFEKIIKLETLENAKGQGAV